MFENYSLLKTLFMKDNVLKTKSFDFAVRIVSLYRFLKKEHKEHILSAQLIRSGTCVGAIVREAEHAESLKEANEVKYWLDILVATQFINQKMHESINKDCEELLKLLTASVKTSKLRTK